MESAVREVLHPLCPSGEAVCDSYGDAYLYIMKNKLGIPCELVASEVMAHAWNMIEIGGKWYHVDVAVLVLK